MRNAFWNKPKLAGLAVAGTLTVAAAVTGGTLSAQASPLPTTSARQTVVDSQATAHKRVAATPAGLLVALLRDLPEGDTSNYAGNAASESGNVVTQLMAQTYLDTGSGPGMLRLAVDYDAALKNRPVHKPTHKRTKKDKRTGITTTTWTQKDGDTVTVTRIPDNCVQSLVVSVAHTSGVITQLDVASCLAWDGTQNPEATEALTVKQALRVADDERLGLKLPKKLVAEGAERFPNLPSIS